MVRTQLQIDEPTYETLRQEAHREHKSMSALAREILQEHFKVSIGTKGLRGKKFSFISSGDSGRSDISVRHDEALAEDFR